MPKFSISFTEVKATKTSEKQNSFALKFDIWKRTLTQLNNVFDEMMFMWLQFDFLIGSSLSKSVTVFFN